VSGESTEVRQFLRHTVAALAYRAEKVLRDAPVGFAEFRLGETSRTPGEILAHLGDLMDWALAHLEGQQVWRDSEPLPWPQEVERFFVAVGRLDDALASTAPIGCSVERFFQGPIADALTHVGQLAMLRRLAGSRVRGENYFKAEVAAGRVGQQQSDRRVEFD
jgi:hypothetical protein